jgi:hypothetical protein
VTFVLGRDRLLARALLASLALHLLVFALIPRLVSSGNGPAIETLSIVRIISISVRPATPAPAPLPVHVTAPRPQAHAPAPARHARVIALHPAARRAHVPATTAPAPAAAVQSQSAPPAPSAAATPQPTSAPQPQQPVAGMMPLGVDEPVPVLERSARQALVALGVHVTLTIDVDARGRTTKVSFSPDLDPSLEAKIRELLSEASWDPAVCGAGLACEGVATIRL